EFSPALRQSLSTGTAVRSMAAVRLSPAIAPTVAKRRGQKCSRIATNATPPMPSQYMRCTHHGVCAFGGGVRSEAFTWLIIDPLAATVLAAARASGAVPLRAATVAR